MKQLFEALSQEERDAIIDPKGTSKLPTKELNMPNCEGLSQNSEIKCDDIKASSSNSKKEGKKKADEVENDTVRHPYNHHLVIGLRFLFSTAGRRQN